ncbi:MAG TPA: hypothetical protein VK327_01350, partial [Candidatus Paceibacterota bacterium]|nr:hypothetical protein [Candidatus Paceibacterota bacterium]
MRPGVSIGLGSLAAAVFGLTGQVSAGIAVITLWSLGFVFVQAQRFINCLYRSPDLNAFWLLPIDDSTIFQTQLRKALRGTLWFLFDLICAYGAFALQEDISPYVWIVAVAFAVLTWLHILALALLALVYLRRFPFELVSGMFYLGTLALFLCRSFLEKPVLAFLRDYGSSLNLLLPSGWPATLFCVFLPGNHWLFIILVVPIAITLLTIRNSLARLKGNYQFLEPITSEPRDLPLETAEHRPT